MSRSGRSKAARPSPPRHAEDEGVPPHDVRGLILAEHGGELPREEVDGPDEPLVDLGGPYTPEIAVHAHHLVAEKVLSHGEDALVACRS